MRNIFCANDQKVTEHELVVDANNEVVATCECGAFLKVPANLGEEKIAAFFDANELNDGQVKVDEEAEAKQAEANQKLLDQLGA